MTDARQVFVEAPARLHMGLIDLRGDLGRRFGGIGAALEAPSLLLEARPAERLSAEGDEAERLLPYARRYLERNQIAGGAAFRVQRAIPAHSGLGSGTQLALAAARALAALYDRPFEASGLADATGRAQRSAIGTWAFEQGGFLLEGGRREPGEGLAPLLLRRSMPSDWRCVLVIPDVPPGLSGAAEEEAFDSLPPPSPELVGRIARLILMLVLPALVEEDLPGFGRGVSEVQRLVGEMFQPLQGARFAHPQVAALVEALQAEGAWGAGQSSWGPAVFGLAQNETKAQRIADRLRGRAAGRAPVLVTAFDNRGARCWG
jgi:beta-RFAP synthase